MIYRAFLCHNVNNSLILTLSTTIIDTQLTHGMTHKNCGTSLPIIHREKPEQSSTNYDFDLQDYEGYTLNSIGYLSSAEKYVIYIYGSLRFVILSAYDKFVSFFYKVFYTLFLTLFHLLVHCGLKATLPFHYQMVRHIRCALKSITSKPQRYEHFRASK